MSSSNASLSVNNGGSNGHGNGVASSSSSLSSSSIEGGSSGGRRLSRALSANEWDQVVSQRSPVRHQLGRDETQLGKASKGVSEDDGAAGERYLADYGRVVDDDESPSASPSASASVGARATTAAASPLESNININRSASPSPLGTIKPMRIRGHSGIGQEDDTASMSSNKSPRRSPLKSLPALPPPLSPTSSSPPPSLSQPTSTSTSPPPSFADYSLSRPHLISPTRPSTSSATMSTGANSRNPDHLIPTLALASSGSGSSPSGGRPTSTVSSSSHPKAPNEWSDDLSVRNTGERNSSIVSLMDGSPRKGRRGSAPQQVDDGKATSSGGFGNTMRKTSRFFKMMTGGGRGEVGGSTGGMKSESSLIHPSVTPIAASYSSRAPPVPSIPTDYSSSSNTTTPTKQRQPVITSRVETPRQSSSVDLDIKSPPRPKPLPRDASTNSLTTPNHDRRRSLSVGSAGAAALEYLRRTPESPKILVPRSPVTRGSTKSEDERLKSELQQWKLNLDGVLGTATPQLGTAGSLSRSPSSRTGEGETAFLPTFTSHEAAFKGRRPNRNEQGSSSKDKDEEGVVKVVGRSASLPDPPSSTTPMTTDEGPNLPPKETTPPIIRLVSPGRTGETGANGEDGVRRMTSSPTDSNGSNERRGSAVAVDGLGLSTIVETGQSKETTQVTPTKTNPSADNSAATTPRSLNPPPPFVLHSSDSPTPSPDPFRPSNQRNRAIRASVVSYPSATSSSTSLLNAPNGSSSRSSPKPPSSPDVSFQNPEELFSKAKSFAQRIWDEDESFLAPKKFAEWLGSSSKLNSLTLSLWIDHFDFSGQRLDMAFRRLCEKLYLKAETQQVDRILEQFSRRFFEQNGNEGTGNVFASRDVVHATAYSLLLLNTDLHVVDSTSRMTRAQFVKNTLAAVQSQTEAEAEGEGDVFGGKKEVGMMPKSESSITIQSAGMASTKSLILNEGLEAMLKEMYTSIKANPIFQPLSSPEASRSSLSLSAPHPNSPYSTWNGIQRTSSRRSATSTMSSSSLAFKRQSLRGFGTFLGASSSSSGDMLRSSSPTPSTATSLSEEQSSTTAYGASSHHHHHNVPTIGFASSLSHTIIREQQEEDLASDGDMSMTDEELALLGAPWAKEGLLWRKHYWETTGKRAKEKNWLQAFVVVSAGELKMFRFDMNGGSRGGVGGMGGGDWTSNAQSVGQVSLIHALCSAMPPPGYSRDRPHCFILTLPSGGSYFFQAGTPDLVSEWVSTCNYWSTRLSKEPLSGGVSNMDYGWNRVSFSMEENEREEVASARSGRSSGGTSRFSASTFAAPSGSGVTNANDRIVVNEWKPPNVPMGASQLAEEAQSEALKKYAEILKKDLAHHNNLRGPMTRLYSARSTNAVKSLANWERKSQYLLAEIVKYQTYIDALSSAIKLRSLKRGQKEVNAMLESADLDDDERHNSGDDGRGITTYPSWTEGQISTPIAMNMTRTRTTSPSRSNTAENSPTYSRHQLGTPSALSVTTNGTQEDKFFDPETPTTESM